MRGSKANKICLEKIIKYCDSITEICKKHNFDKEVFEQDEEFQLACSMCVIQIGELVGRLDNALKEKHPDIPWNSIKGMRNIFAHDYDIVKADTLWETVNEDIPKLKKIIEPLLKDR